MDSYYEQRSALLAAARQARDIGLYLTSFPSDRSGIETMREAALTIEVTAQALGVRELIELSIRLSDTANGVISSARGIEKLNRIVTEILAVAEMLGNSRTDWTGPENDRKMEI